MFDKDSYDLDLNDIEMFGDILSESFPVTYKYHPKIGHIITIGSLAYTYNENIPRDILLERITSLCAGIKESFIVYVDKAVSKFLEEQIKNYH